MSALPSTVRVHIPDRKGGQMQVERTAGVQQSLRRGAGDFERDLTVAHVDERVGQCAERSAQLGTHGLAILDRPPG